MVKFIFILIFIVFSFCAKSQDNNSNKSIELIASFNKDTVSLDEKVSLILIFKNTSDSVYEFYPEAIIGMVPHTNLYIFYNSPEKILYRLNNYCNLSNSIRLKPGEEFKNIYEIKINTKFFSLNDNELIIFYHLFKKNKDLKKIRNNKPSVSIWSKPINLYLKS
jgi:hypothetical protein